jgi:hypothetical protein
MNRLNSKIVVFKLGDEEFRLRPLSARMRLKAAEVRAAVEGLSESEKFLQFTLAFICPALASAMINGNGEPVYQPDCAPQIADDFTGDELDALMTEVFRISGLSVAPDEVVKNSEPSPSDATP